MFEADVVGDASSVAYNGGPSRSDGLSLGPTVSRLSPNLKVVTLPEQRVGERRHAVRRRCLLAGRLALNGGVIVPCGVKNITEGGALVVVDTPLVWPERVLLLIHKDAVAHDAKLAWRWRDCAGLHFLQSYDMRQSVPDEIRRLQRVWQTLTF